MGERQRTPRKKRSRSARSAEDEARLRKARITPRWIRRADAGDAEAADYLAWALLQHGRWRHRKNVDLAKHYASIAIAGGDPWEADSAARSLLYSDGEGGSSAPRPNGADPTWAIRMLQRLARRGNVHAMHSMYLACWRGAGVPRDVDAAERWARRAAAHGDGEPLNNLGVSFREGRGVRRDIRRAVRCYRRAAAVGERYALWNLSRCHRDGEGVRQDDRESGRLLRLALRPDRGNPFIPSGIGAHLGWLLVEGRGVRRDRRRGLQLIRRAARRGNEGALEMLAELGLGQGELGTTIKARRRGTSKRTRTST